MRRSHAVAGVGSAMFHMCALPEAEPEVGVSGGIRVGRQRAEVHRLVACPDEAWSTSRAGVERHDVHGDADLLQFVANDCRAALEVRGAPSASGA